MVIEGILFVVVTIFSIGAQAGPLGHHQHSKFAKQEWNVTAVLMSGKTDNPDWVITEMDRKNDNVDVIARALDIYSHSSGIGKKLKSTSGYKGFTIRHVLDGKTMETIHLPACTFPFLERALINYTAPSTMNAYYKHLILCTLKYCGKKVPSECYARPETNNSKKNVVGPH